MSGCYSFYLVSKWLLLYVLRSANLWRGFRGQRAMESVVLVGKYEGCLSEKNSKKNTIWHYKKVLIKSYRSMYRCI